MGCDLAGEAAAGDDGCAKYLELKPDLVTVDLILPKKGGLDALRDIRAADPKAKVVVISAIEQRQPLMQALKLGAADYVVKPFEKDRVEEAISRVIAGSSAAAT
jgi:two-component system chemotaxis response regulator CheY